MAGTRGAGVVGTFCDVAPGAPGIFPAFRCAGGQPLPPSQGAHQPGGGEEFPSDPKSGNSWTPGCVGRTCEPGKRLSICCFCPALSQPLFPRKGKIQRPYYRAGKKAISFVALSDECGSPEEQLCSAALTQSPGPRSANKFLFENIPVSLQNPHGYFPALAW